MYIDSESNIPKRSGLLSALWLMFIISIPTACFGVFSATTKLIMIPITVFMSLWILYLLVKFDNKRLQVTLFFGIFSIYISASMLTAAYKISVMVMSVSGFDILIIILLYVLASLLHIFNILRLIKKGHYGKKGRKTNPLGSILTASLLGLSIGKLFVGGISQDLGIKIMVICLMILGFLCLFGTSNFVKYYFYKKIQRTNLVN